MGYHRANERNRRIKKLYEETKNSYGAGAHYDEKKKRYVKSTTSNIPGYTKSLRKISNKKLRQSNDEEAPIRGSSYKKMYDYWWELF